MVYRPGKATKSAEMGADLAIGVFLLRRRFTPKDWDRLSLVSAEYEIKRAMANVKSAKSDMPQSYGKLLDILHDMTGGFRTDKDSSLLSIVAPVGDSE